MSLARRDRLILLSPLAAIGILTIIPAVEDGAHGVPVRVGHGDGLSWMRHDPCRIQAVAR